MLGCRVERILPDFGLIQLRAGFSLIDLADLSRPGGAGAGGRILEHFCLRVDPFDPEAIRAHLTCHGVRGGPVERRYGADGHGLSMDLEDPEVNRIELKGPPDPDQREQRSEAIPGPLPGRT